MFKKIRKFALAHKRLLVPVIIVILVTTFLLLPKNGQEILTEQVSKKDIAKTVSVTGDVDADTSVNLTFKTAGKLVYLGAKEGDFIEAYQTIATLDQQTALKSLKGSLLDYSIQRNTFESTQDTYQDRKPYQALNDEMKRILENNQYNLDKAINSVELQELSRRESILTTPIAGIVTRADVKVAGVNITTATTYTVTDPSSLNFKMEVDEADIGKVVDGQEVKITFDSFPDSEINLAIDSIDFVSHKTLSGGNAFYVKAQIQDPSKYRVGMSGNADIIIDKRSSVLTVNISSIFDDNFVYVEKNGKFEKRKIKLGLESDIDAEVLSGLSLGEKVALDPNTVPQNAK
ncbi:MAG: hypothetical protein A2798_02565 [Candidatus Levybacteria bacterium RIFCSPHIGHO2_01_FULL_37_17]|nr:MAG: hypothetical protein A2798_02565 [Candidatus Levybacteria bacterium RIFCSPHIGHO2_01_FULL_37_17]OGH36750.1 MAG: hypothetical protein A2959_00555 [Candidatus Levybacteria bacterium RIFCSPLOWO2_01_FULL_38_23]